MCLMGIDYDQLYVGCLMSATQEYDFDLDYVSRGTGRKSDR